MPDRRGGSFVEAEQPCHFMKSRGVIGRQRAARGEALCVDGGYHIID